MLLKMSSGTILAGFSVEPWGEKTAIPGNGWIMSLTKKKKWALKQSRGAAIFKYDPYCFTMGNNDIKIYAGGEVTSIFGKNLSSFSQKG